MSTLRVNTLQNTSGVEVYTAKAWVNFNGTGTVAIRAAGNVSSITDNGTGDYTVNFTVAMTNANYACNLTTDCGAGGANLAIMSLDFTTPRTASLVRMLTFRPAALTVEDSPLVSVSVFR